MKGLELARKFYEEHGQEMIATRFADVADRICIGLVGEGSECLGYDDEISTDHDFEPAFCLFIAKEDEKKFGFELERAYSKLPKQFMGYERQKLSAAGGKRHGVIVIDDFYKKFLGAANAPDTIKRWLYTPSQSLLNASNGEVFRDDLGLFSAIRNEIKKGYPRDIRLKKIAAHTIFMAQAGLYNYPRLIKRGEAGASQLAVFEFVKNAISVIYLLNNRYEPFYKWAYRGMRELEILGNLCSPLAALTELGNSPEESAAKVETIEEIAQLLINEYRKTGISDSASNELEAHAYAIIKGIESIELRNMHIMQGI